MRAYSESLSRWSEWLEIIGTTEQQIRQDGLTTTTPRAVREALTKMGTCGSSVRLAAELIEFVSEQCQPLRENERVPGTTEVLESAFGKQKSLEGSPTKTGFTSLLLGLGAAVGKTTAEIVHQALETCGIKHVRAWCREHLGTTLTSKRQLAYASDKNSDD